MRVLYITGSCLTKNTSANMSHNSYLQGLIENSAKLDIVTAKDGWGSEDNKLPKFEGVHYYEFESVSWIDKLRIFARKFFPQGSTPTITIPSSQNVISENTEKKEKGYKKELRNYIKSIFYSLFKPDPIYPIHSVWLKNASKFKSETLYDIVISNSSPAASHRLVINLAKKGHICYKRWIQIWEDPWYHDLYGNHSQIVLNEEQELLREAQEIYYVSPLTLHYQKQYFPDCAEKMKFIPLPFLKFSEEKVERQSGDISFGYFGDYYSYTRNLRPFYEALVVSGLYGNIYGDSDLHLQNTERICISGRVTLDVLDKVQEETTVLVHLCNLRGGQIPGKIYHYSATKKPILFILDGTEEEQSILHDFFSQYNRYVFCKNTKEDILRAILELKTNIHRYDGFVVDDFSPKQVVASLLKQD